MLHGCPPRLLMLAWGGFPTPYKPAWRAATCPSRRSEPAARLRHLGEPAGGRREQQNRRRDHRPLDAASITSDSSQAGGTSPGSSHPIGRCLLDLSVTPTRILRAFPAAQGPSAFRGRSWRSSLPRASPTTSPRPRAWSGARKARHTPGDGAVGTSTATGTLARWRPARRASPNDPARSPARGAQTR